MPRFRVILLALAFLLIGAAVNVGVAWILGAAETESRQIKRIVVVLTGRPDPASIERSPVPRQIHVGRSGWPVASLIWEEWLPPIESPWREGVQVAAGTVIPLRPVWPGFALNTLLYGGLAAGLWNAPGFGRRTVRSRRGLCPRCGYPRAGLAEGTACPECGGVPR
jgi:hypothetical protein